MRSIVIYGILALLALIAWAEICAVIVIVTVHG
jgi:hypothetical protein